MCVQNVKQSLTPTAVSHVENPSSPAPVPRPAEDDLVKNTPIAPLAKEPTISSPPPPSADQKTVELPVRTTASQLEELETELELDLENIKLDENIDTTVSTLFAGFHYTVMK